MICLRSHSPWSGSSAFNRGLLDKSFLWYQPLPEINGPIFGIWRYFCLIKMLSFWPLFVEVHLCDGVAPDLSIWLMQWDLFPSRTCPSFDLFCALLDAGITHMYQASCLPWGARFGSYSPCLLFLATSKVADWGGGHGLCFITPHSAGHSRMKKSSQENRVQGKNQTLEL